MVGDLQVAMATPEDIPDRKLKDKVLDVTSAWDPLKSHIKSDSFNRGISIWTGQWEKLESRTMDGNDWNLIERKHQFASEGGLLQGATMLMLLEFMFTRGRVRRARLISATLDL